MTEFVISDTHFSHKNSLVFMRKDNPNIRMRHEFDDLDVMNETIVERINKTVGFNNTIIFGGDFSFGGKHNIAKFARRINAKRKILLMGNHDYNAKDYVDHFDEVSMWWQSRAYAVPVVFTHVPQHVFGFRSRFDDPAINIHGHLHDVLTGEPHHVNVCVENINYTPVAVEEIADRFR